MELVAAEDVLPILRKALGEPGSGGDGMALPAATYDCAERMVERALGNGQLDLTTSTEIRLIDTLWIALQELVDPLTAGMGEQRARALLPDPASMPLGGELTPETEQDCRRLLEAVYQHIVRYVRQVSDEPDAAFEARYKEYVAQKFSWMTFFGIDLARSSTRCPIRPAYVPPVVTVPPAGVISLDEMLELYPRVVLRGEAGSGKSTALQWLAVDTGRVPFLLPLRSTLRRGAMPSPVDFLAAVGCPFGQPEGWAHRVLAEGRGLLLLDGLDEVARTDRQVVHEWIAEMSDAYPRARWVVSCRPSAVPSGEIPGFSDAVLHTFDAGRVEEAVRRWHSARFVADADEDRTAGRKASLLALLRSRPDLAALARTPLLCHVLCALHAESGVQSLATRTDLYGRLLDMLLVRRDRERGITAFQSEDLTGHEQIHLLARLAVWLLRNGVTEVAHTIAAQNISHSLRSMSRLAQRRPEEILSHLVHRSGLLRTPADGVLDFTHRPFQDYLAAHTLLDDGYLGELMVRADDDRWREVYPYAMGLASAPERARLLEGLVQRGDAERERALSLRHHLLAASCLAEATVVDPDTRQAVMDRVASHLPPRTQEEAAAFASVGPTVLALLPDPDEVSREQHRAFLDLLHRMPGPEAAAASRRFAPLPVPELPTALRRLPEPPPGARELAVALSVATRIEPELIRAVRLGVFPLLDAGDEADLWFSAWAAARTPQAMALRPELLPVLRAELAERLATAEPGDPIREVGKIIAEVHMHISPALHIEERLNWLDVTGALAFDGGQEIAESMLAPALRALVEEGRDGVADWLAGAWLRLPAPVRESVRAWQLVTAAAHQVPDAGLEPLSAPAVVTAADVAVIVESVGDAVLTVSRGVDTVTLGAGPGTAQDTGILVPDTDPRLVEVLLVDEGGAVLAVHTATVPPGETRTLTVGDGQVRLRTPRGDVYELSSESGPGTDRSDAVAGDEPVLRSEGAHWYFRVSAGQLAVPQILARIEQEVRAARRGFPEGPPTRQELGIWRQAVSALSRLLVEAGRKEVEVIIGRYAGPAGEMTDVTLAGFHPSTGEPSYVAVEVKGWRGLVVDPGDSRLCRPGRKSRQEAVNPVEQVLGRCEYLVESHEMLRLRPGRLAAAVFLPQARSTDVEGLPDVLEPGLFTGDMEVEFSEYLRLRLTPQSGWTAGDMLLSDPLIPRRGVLQSAAEFHERRPFHALGEQLAVLGHAMSAVSRGERRVVVVSGAAGTGKTAVALMLLHEARQVHPSAVYVSGLRAFVEGLRMRLRRRQKRKVEWLRFPNQFGIPGAPDSSSRDRLALLVCDDAEFIRPTSNSRFTAPDTRSQRAQIDELLDAADVSVFLVDEGMALRADDVGSAELVLGAARAQGLPTVRVDLRRPFRFGGDGAYPRWVAALLGESPAPWVPAGPFAVLTAGSPEEMRAFLLARRRAGESARMTGHGEPSIPRTQPEPSRWAVEESGFERTGWAHEAAGFEFDWCGVVLGPDFVHRDDRWRTVREESHDPAVRGRSVSDAEANRLIRNAYRVLLTRGARGVVLCSTDPETQQALRSLVGELQTVSGFPSQ